MIERTHDPKRLAALEAELDLPPLPRAAWHVWRTYFRLRRRKGSGGFGVMPIEWPDIDAFARRARARLDPFDLEMIEMIDDVFLAEMMKHEKQRRDT